MNNMNFYHVLKTNGVHTDRKTDRQSLFNRGALVLKIVGGGNKGPPALFKKKEIKYDM